MSLSENSTKSRGLKMGLNCSKKETHSAKSVRQEPVRSSARDENEGSLGANKSSASIKNVRIPVIDALGKGVSNIFLSSEDEGEVETINSRDGSGNSPKRQSTSGVSSITTSPMDSQSTDDESAIGESNSESGDKSTALQANFEYSTPRKITFLKKIETAAKSQPSPAPPKPPMLTFYIPRKVAPPMTKDARKLTLTPYQRINMTSKSKLVSNIKGNHTVDLWKNIQNVWKSINNLTKVRDWEKLKVLHHPVLICLKLVELRYSLVKVISNVSDFNSCSALFEILYLVSLSPYEYHKTEVMREIATPQFMETLLKVVESCHRQRPRKPELLNFVENMVDVYGDIFLQLDSLATDGLADDLTKVVNSFVKLFSSQSEDSSLAAYLNQLLSILSSRDSLIRANSCFPFDILKEESVEVNIIDGPFVDFDQYLSIHYRLLKEDFQNSLREGILKYLKTLFGYGRTTINYQVTIYPNVTLVRDLTKYSVKFRIIFNNPAVIRQLQDPASRSFLSGALLVLTPYVPNSEPFKDYYLVRVEDNSPLEREKNFIFISIILGPDNPIDSIEVLMVEPSQLFEPYYRVMNMIRSLDANDFPFTRYIVEVKTDVLPPAYMKPTTKLQVGNTECLLWEDGSWPPPESLELNKVQLDGLKLALRSELAIIQGPPGTGKTYLSRKIVEVLLQNKSLWHSKKGEGAGLIVVVCFKNQSLDQLLGGLVKAGKKVLRVGKNSRDETLDEYNLHTLQKPMLSEMYFQMRRELGKEQEDLMDELTVSIDVVRKIIDHQGLIKLAAIRKYMYLSGENWDYLSSNYEHWLIDVPYQLSNFNRIDRILKEIDFENENFTEENHQSFFQVSYRDIDLRLDALNAKIDNLVQVGAEEYINDLIDAASYLAKKRDFLQENLSKICQPLTCDMHKQMMDVKLIFESSNFQPSLETLPLELRWVLYKAWVNDLYQFHSDKIKNLTSKNRDQFHRFVEIEELLNVRKIAQSNAEVIGMTTTAAAKYYRMMDFLKPKIVLVEEAAEVMEGHTIASLSKHCEHLILVGDHKQLRPLTSSYLIGKDAHLDISMYERLVRNGLPHCTLNTQYRMRPEISSLIAPAVYPNLVNDSSVYDLPHVLGVNADLYFVDHSIKEDWNPHFVSRWNKYEAEFLLALCFYLVRQGYQPDQVTILATYSEQEKYFNKEKLNYPELEGVLMATVDSFQGKESDIILLSLVRSNDEGNIGFLAQKNRINVALSRAKRGLFIIGNSESLLAKGGLWHEVVDVLLRTKAIGSSLPLKCQIHEKITRVETPKDLKLLRNGGCAMTCRASLACGHKCIHRCHPTDRLHEDVFKCSNKCKKRMDCSHVCILTCHIYNKMIKCFCGSCTPKTKCEFKFSCGHICKSMGHAEDVDHKDKYRCNEICNTVLMCGHTCCSLCHVEDVSHKERYKCPIVCEGKFLCGHPCHTTLRGNKNHTCSDHKKACCAVCEGVMPCGHICKRICHIQDRNHETDYKCLHCSISEPPEASISQSNSDSKIDKKKLTDQSVNSKATNAPTSLDGANSDSGMNDMKDSSEQCIHGQSLLMVCSEVCGFKYPCGHSCLKKCRHGTDATHSEICRRNCDLVFACGHRCNLLCHWKASSRHVSQKGCKECRDSPCSANLQCGHQCSLKLHANDNSHVCLACTQLQKLDQCIHGQPLLMNCSKICGFKKPCGHSCLKKCRHVADATHSKKCKQMCDSFFACGHLGTRSCHRNGSSSDVGNTFCRKCKKLPCTVNLLCGHQCSLKRHAKDKIHECLTCSSASNVGANSVSGINEMENSLNQCIHGNSLLKHCIEICGFKKPCGHLCLQNCSHVADATHSKKCKQMCDVVFACGHPGLWSCHKNESSPGVCNKFCSKCKGCSKICGFKYPCGHSCTKKLRHTADASHSKSCKRMCQHVLACGHPCTMPCHSSPHVAVIDCKKCKRNCLHP